MHDQEHETDASRDELRERAIELRRQADDTNLPMLRAKLLDAAARWEHLAALRDRPAAAWASTALA